MMFCLVFKADPAGSAGGCGCLELQAAVAAMITRQPIIKCSHSLPVRGQNEINKQFRFNRVEYV